MDNFLFQTILKDEHLKYCYRCFELYILHDLVCGTRFYFFGVSVVKAYKEMRTKEMLIQKQRFVDTKGFQSY